MPSRKTSRQRILDLLEQNGPLAGGDLRELLGISRQAMAVHLRALMEEGLVARSGRTRGAVYRLVSDDEPAEHQEWRLSLDQLDESSVYEQCLVRFNLGRRLSKGVEAIVRYAFTEMLNNAIDHSESSDCVVRFELSPTSAAFRVRDRGIGIFRSIADKYDLPTEDDAMVELLKGRTTTRPEAHTGEGIYFTSRVADTLVIRSHRLEVEWSRRHEDVFVRKKRRLEGTDVNFRIARHSTLRLEDVFSEWAPEEFDFELRRTRMLVKLLRSRYVSRSEAKRLCANLEEFREVLLDFRHVEGIGQGFADEVFRVFAEAHPETKLKVENANSAVSAMIRHVGARSDSAPPGR